MKRIFLFLFSLILFNFVQAQNRLSAESFDLITPVDSLNFLTATTKLNNINVWRKVNLGSIKTWIKSSVNTRIDSTNTALSTEKAARIAADNLKLNITDYKELSLVISQPNSGEPTLDDNLSGGITLTIPGPLDMSTYATTTSVTSETTARIAADSLKANKTEIGKASPVYYYVNRLTTMSRTTQNTAAVRGSTFNTYSDIYAARDAFWLDVKNGVLTTGVIYVFSGNTVKVAEDTCTVYTGIDYYVPASTNAQKLYGNYDSDSTSVRTSNLALSNLTYIFEDNTKVYNYCSSPTMLASEGGQYGSTNVNGIFNFGFYNLDYESFIGQAYSGSGTKKSNELWFNYKSKNITLKFKNFYCRRAITPLGGNGNPTFEVSGKYYTKTHQCEQNIADSNYIVRSWIVNDYRVGGGYTNDTTFTVADVWAGDRFYNMNNATYFWKTNTVFNDDGSNFIGIFALYGTPIKNSVLNFDIKNYYQKFPKYYTFDFLNHTGTKDVSMFTFGGVQTNKYSVNIEVGNIKAESRLIGEQWGGSTDSVTYNINIGNADFDATRDGSTNRSDRYLINSSMINKASVLKINVGNLTCKGFAGIANITGGTGTIILNGNFTTLDDKPIITVTSGFTGKLIINGKLIVGSEVTSPSSGSIVGSGTAIIQSVLTNIAASATTIGNTISVNSAFK